MTFKLTTPVIISIVAVATIAIGLIAWLIYWLMTKGKNNNDIAGTERVTKHIKKRNEMANEEKKLKEYYTVDYKMCKSKHAYAFATICEILRNDKNLADFVSITPHDEKNEKEHHLLASFISHAVERKKGEIDSECYIKAMGEIDPSFKTLIDAQDGESDESKKKAHDANILKAANAFFAKGLNQLKPKITDEKNIEALDKAISKLEGKEVKAKGSGGNSGSANPPAGSGNPPPASGGNSNPPPASGGNGNPPPASGGNDNPPPASGGNDNPPPASGGNDNPPPASGGNGNPPPASGGNDNPPPASGGNDNPPPASGGNGNPPPASGGNDNPPPSQQSPQQQQETASSEGSGGQNVQK